MSTFSRLSNLAKGLALTRGGTADPDAEAALERELATAPPRKATRPMKQAAPQPPEAEARPPVELDEHGNAKRTL